MGVIGKIKRWFGGIWTPIDGRTGGNYFGGFPGEPPPDNPTPTDLLTAYEDIVFSCVNRIAQGVAEAATNFKLCVSTEANQARPKSLTKALTSRDRKWIDKTHRKRIRKAVAVEEVTDHPALDILDRPNPTQSWPKLVELTTEYMGLIGSAFLFKAKDDLGRVRELWLLPSHLVTILVDDETGSLQGYKFRSGETEETYQPDEVIHIRYTPDPIAPYTSFGVAPLRAIWQRFSLLRAEQGSWQSVLRNMAYPSLLVSPPDSETWTPQQAERIEKQLNERFRWGNQGGVWAVQDSAKVNPLSTPPKDVAALTMYDQVRKSVAQVYNVPLPMLDMADTNFTSADVARRNFQEYCVLPLVSNIFEQLSHDLLPPRMWLAAENFIQRDEVFELQKSTALFQGGITQQNEAREEQGYDPVPNGDKFFFELMDVGTPSAQTFVTSYQGGRTKSNTRKYVSQAPDPGPLAEKLRGIYQKLGQEVLGRFKATDGYKTKSFFPVQDWKAEMARELTPVIRAYFDEGSNAVNAELGGQLQPLAVNSLTEAVEKAVLAFAESTLSTTNLSVQEAVDATRRAVEEGLAANEANDQLAKRIGDIFEDLSDRRVMLIAETESSRAKHQGELMAIKASGVECKKRWLPDSMACDVCKGLARKGGVDLDKPYAVNGTGPYARIDHPPAHPACRCSQQFEFQD